MIVVDNTIITDDIVDQCFACDLGCCHGRCCVEGDSGAPLLESELPVLRSILPAVAPYMAAAGRDAVERQGVAVTDAAGELCTPLVDDGECAFVAWGDDGTAYCAIERAYRDGTISFPKPVSCHLYPLRVDDFGRFVSVNYHRWEVCRGAVAHGRQCGVPLYRYLRQPLIRRFGQQWYDQLLDEIALGQQQQQ